jgi:hypothetical protein|tara:strand:- start:763 stop:1335 length:573 start_codon:yes stop_codon:yes gene_type:complete
MSALRYWIWPPQFDNKEIKTLNKFIDHNYLELEPKEGAASGSSGKRLKQERHTKLIEWQKIEPYFKKVYGYAEEIITHEFGYITFKMFDDRLINFATYTSKEKDYYGWHVDRSPEGKNFDVKGTLLINMSDTPYKGGDLRLFNQGPETVTDFKKPGSMILFDGFMSHEVTPVTQGTRKTIAIFMTGPKWR